MDITIGIICMGLEQRFQINTNIPMERDIPVKGLRIWGGERPAERILYVCREMPPEGTEWKGKLLIGINTGQSLADSGAFYISVAEPVEFDRLMNALQEIFEEFYLWRGETERLFYSQADFTAILNELEQRYGLVSILVDKNLRYIAMSDSYSLCNSWVRGRKTMELDLVNELMTDPAFRDAIGHNKPFFYCNVGDEAYSCCYNIKIKGRYEARLLIQNREMGKFYGGITFAGYAGERLGEILARRSSEKQQETALYDFYHLLRDLLKGVPRSGEEIRQYLQVRGWQREHVYQVYSFQFISQENESMTRRYYQVEMEQLFQECCILADDESLCCIRTLIQYDRKAGTELVKSAYAYMKHRYNVTQTARFLYIHRTTMLFRLQRIELLTGLDWDCWEDRIHLAVTFELMKRNGEAEWGDDN